MYHCFERFKWEAQPVLDCAAIHIYARIRVRLQEMVHEVSVAEVQLDAVEARTRNSGACGRTKLRDVCRDFGAGKRAGGWVSSVPVEGGHVSVGLVVFGCKEGGVGGGTCEEELDDNEGAVGVDGVRDLMRLYHKFKSTFT
jgi:hypothetical protein